MVPHLVTALSGPLLDLERRILDATPAIERWFRLEWQEHTPPFYCSVDLRNAGFKIAPVDTNLFPGGFNNLSPDVLPLAVQAAMAAIDKICPDARNLLLIPENHTRNMFYLQNVARLSAILRQTGLNVRLGSLNPEITEPTRVELPDGQHLMLEPMMRTGPNGRRLGLKNFDPCAILLNNDLSSGIPDILRNVDDQFVLPPVHAGWAVRRKSKHFSAYDDVAKKFAKLLDIDQWMINPYFAACGEVNFQERTGEDCLSSNVDTLLAKIRKKYKEYGIKETPFVIVKADAGTYGMGIMSVKDASEVKNLNRKTRNKMSVVKEGMEVSEVLIQEGVHTSEEVQGGVAEPVVYMMDRYVVGGFYRVHADRGVDENLNAPGMHFVPLPFASSCNLPDPGQRPSAAPNRFYAYGVVARLALLAASLELERTDPNPKCIEAMQIAFIADPLPGFKTYKDSTYAMMVEAARRGHDIWYLQQGDLARTPGGRVEASCVRLELVDVPDDAGADDAPSVDDRPGGHHHTELWYRLDAPVVRALAEFDAVVMRKDPPFDMEYVYSTYFLERAEAEGARVFNRPRAIRDHNEKFAITEFPEWTAPTLVTRDAARVRAFHAEHGDVILKPLDGMGGAGIFRVRADAMNLGAIVETLTAYGTRTMMAQKYIPAISAGDKRVLVIDGEPAPFALARIPQGTEVRGNLAAGGLGVAQLLTERDRAIAEAIGPELARRGLLLVGLDVIGDYLTEINVTSPTCFQEITQQTGFNVASMFIDALERRVRLPRSQAAAG